MPYPIPDAPATDGDFVYFVVAVPNDRQSVRNAKGLYTSMGQPYAHGLEGRVPESDTMAGKWLLAINETWRLLEMGWPDDVLAAIDEVEDLLRQSGEQVPCCGGSEAVHVGPDSTLKNTGSPIEDNVGDPPATYGSQAVADWAGWEDWKCEAAYFAVEQAALLFENLDDLRNLPTPMTVEQVAEYMGAIPILGEALEVAWRAAYELLLLAWDAILDLDQAAADIRASADTIACDIFTADGPEAAATAMQTAIDAAVTGDASAVVPWLPYTQWANMVYEGTIENTEGETVHIDQHLTPGTNACCEASYDGSLAFTDDNGALPMRNTFTLASGSAWSSSGEWVGNRKQEWMYADAAALQAAGLPVGAQIQKVEVYGDSNASSNPRIVLDDRSGIAWPGGDDYVLVTGTSAWYDLFFPTGNADLGIGGYYDDADGPFVAIRALTIHYTV